MNGGERRMYRFGSFSLDVAERQLFERDTPIRLTPKAFDVLAFLLANGGHLVGKDELMNAVWPDAFIEEVNLPRTIYTLRKALGEGENGNKFIETVPTKGYRFVAEVMETSGNGRTVRVAESVSDTDKPDENGSSINILESQNGNSRAFSPKRKEWPRRRVFVILTILLLATGAGAVFLLLNRSRMTNAVVKDLRPYTSSGEAYQHYQQGRFFVERRHKGDYEEALKSFEKAIELDPDYSDAYAGLADVKVVRFWGSGTHEDISQARTAVRRAIELDDSNSYAHTILCRILTTYDWDHAEAEKECRRAVELNPNDHEAQKELAFFLNSLGREAEALEAMDEAIALAPTSFNKRSRGLILYHSRRYDEAIAQFEQVEETDPAYGETSRWLSRAYEMKKDDANALEWYLRYIQYSGAAPEEIAEIRKDFALGGWPAVRPHMIESPQIGTIFRAGTFAQMGEKDRAFETLEDMFKRRAIMLVTLAREPALDPIRDDPRYHDLLKRIGLNN